MATWIYNGSTGTWESVVTLATGVTVKVSAQDTDAGVKFTLDVVSGYADLRGFFFDEVEANKLTLSSAVNWGNSVYNPLKPPAISFADAACDSNVKSDTLTSVGSSDNNMNGTGETFTAGVEFGSQGIGKTGDDVRYVSFEVQGLDFADLQGLSFGIRATSVGISSTSRDGSVKYVDNFWHNAAPTDITLTNAAVSENAAGGTVIATLGASDPDGNSTFTYSLVGGNGSNDADNGLVVIEGNQIKVKSGALIDFESNPVLNLSIQVTDNGGLTFTKAIQIAVNNLDEVKPVITSAATATAVNENGGAGQVVYTATATDNPDAPHPSDGPSALTFSLGTAGGDEGAFSIHGTTGAVTLTGNPDHEGKASYSFEVVATDAAGNANSQTVTLAVNNLDEVKPVITSAATATAVNENGGAGQVVYTATATDNPDAPHPSDGPSALTFSLGTAGGDEGAFSIHGTTGAVTLTGNPDHEGKASYSFEVVATDAAGNANSQTVTLAVNNLDEVKPVITSAATATAVNENGGAGQVVYTATATDNPDAPHPSDGPSALTFSLGTAGGDEGAFSIHGAPRVR